MASRRRRLMRRAWVLLLLCGGLNACAYQRPASDPGVVNPRFISQLPEGAQCTLLEEIEVLEGNNCMAAGLNQAGQASILRYNVLQKARKRGANTVVPGEVIASQWAGCPDPGLSMQAKLYQCDFFN